jgi:hypothetical protein
VSLVSPELLVVVSELPVVVVSEPPVVVVSGLPVVVVSGLPVVVVVSELPVVVSELLVVGASPELLVASPELLVSGAPLDPPVVAVSWFVPSPPPHAAADTSDSALAIVITLTLISAPCFAGLGSEASATLSTPKRTFVRMIVCGSRCADGPGGCTPTRAKPAHARGAVLRGGDRARLRHFASDRCATV